MPYISFDQLSPLSCRPLPQVARDRMWTSREPRPDSVEVISRESVIRSRGRLDSTRSRDLRQSSRLIGHPVILPQGDALTLSPRGRPPKTDTQGRSRAPLGGSCRPRTESGTRSIAARPVGAIRASGRAGWPIRRPIRICPPYGWTARLCAHVSAAGAPKHKGARPQPRRLQPPDPQPDGSTGPSPAPVRDGRPAPRQHSVPLGGNLDGRAAVLPDRRPGLRRRHLPRVAGATGHQGRPSGPERAHEPPAPRPGTVPGAQCRGTGPRLAQTRVPL